MHRPLLWQSSAAGKEGPETAAVETTEASGSHLSPPAKGGRVWFCKAVAGIMTPSFGQSSNGPNTLENLSHVTSPTVKQNHGHAIDHAPFFQQFLSMGNHYQPKKGENTKKDPGF